MKKISNHPSPFWDTSGSSSSNGIYRQRVNTFENLIEEIAKLSNANNNSMLFFRGQVQDYQTATHRTTLLPSIFRGRIKERERNRRISALNTAEQLLVQKWKANHFPHYNRIKHWQLIRWAILQHYGVVFTPLLDVTQSLRVASSFALNENNEDHGYIYVLALPYLTGRISINSEDQIANARLLSICPFIAKRPYYQEGFVIGDDVFDSKMEDKSKNDFYRRLVAIFEIPNTKEFWATEMAIPKERLYPSNDPVQDLCDEIKRELEI